MFKIILAALPLFLFPVAGLAMCTTHQAASCAEGYTWDGDKNSCVKQVSG